MRQNLSAKNQPMADHQIAKVQLRMIGNIYSIQSNLRKCIVLLFTQDNTLEEFPMSTNSHKLWCNVKLNLGTV